MRMIREWRGVGDAVDFNHALTACADHNSAGEMLIRGVPADGDQPGPILARLPGPVRDNRIVFSPNDQFAAVSNGEKGAWSSKSTGS